MPLHALLVTDEGECLYSLFQTLNSFSYLSTQKWTELSGGSSPTELIYLLKDNVCSKIPWLLTVTPFFLLHSSTPSQILCNINTNNYVSFSSINNFCYVTPHRLIQFQDHICKNRNPPAQRAWHSMETTYNKQEEKTAQLRDRQNENTNIDLKKKT